MTGNGSADTHGAASTFSVTTADGYGADTIGSERIIAKSFQTINQIWKFFFKIISSS